jgi:hypothetical protein
MSFNVILNFKWLGIFLLIISMAVIRPIHQDDGWYASYALRMLGDWGILENVSFFSYADTNGNDNPGGFLFSVLQVPFYAILGINVLAARIFNSIIITSLLYVIHLIIRVVAPSFSWVIIVLLIAHPVFYYHIYNRPESLALLLASISMYLLITANGNSQKTFIAYLLWAFILDVHPIAIFTVAGVGMYYWFNNKQTTKFVIGGGLVGIIMYLGLSNLLNGTFGLFDSLINQTKVNFGDHYLPLFQSDLKDYLRIALERFQTIKSSLLLSLIWILIPLFIFRKCSIKGYVGLVLLNTVTFWVFAIFLTEASSNGFGLYSLFIFMLLFVVLLNSVIDSYQLKSFWNWIIVLPMLLFMIKSNIGLIGKYYEYYTPFQKNFAEIESCIPNGSKVLMRPTFVFNMGLKGLHSDYTFGIFNVMADNNLSFEEAVKLRGYDYVLLDLRNMNEEFLIDKRNNKTFDNAAYIKYAQIGFTTAEFDSLIQKGFLKQVCVFDEASHGKTIFYKVAR